MESFRTQLRKQIDGVPAGVVFMRDDFAFDKSKTGSASVLLCQLAKEGVLVRIGQSAYYRPKESRLGLGKLPLYEEERLSYLARKVGGYLTGPSAYNTMGLTEQVPHTTTIACPQPLRRLLLRTTEVEYVKSYGRIDEKTIPYLRVLDALKDIARIPGTTQQDVYDRVKSKYIKQYGEDELAILSELATSYPPRVRKCLSDMLYDCEKSDIAKALHNTLTQGTKYALTYKTEKS